MPSHNAVVRLSALNAVFVTGAHRSGTTVLGEILSRAANTWEVWEPFNQHWGLASVNLPYRHVVRGVPDPPVDDLAEYLRSGRGRWAVKNQGLRTQQLIGRLRRNRRRRNDWNAAVGRVPIVKDPFALLAIGALQPRLTQRPVVVAVRHPCAWILSLRRMNWPAGPELNALIRQRELYERFLAGMLPDRDWTHVDDLEAGARAWACLYQMVLEQCRTSRVAIVPMETFGESPEETIEFLFGVTGLESQEPVTRLADEYARRSGVVTPEQGEKHELHRDSRALSVAWHGRFDKAEVNAVRALTDPVYSEFYRDWDRADGELAIRGALPEGTTQHPHV